MAENRVTGIAEEVLTSGPSTTSALVSGVAIEALVPGQNTGASRVSGVAIEALIDVTAGSSLSDTVTATTTLIPGLVASVGGGAVISATASILTGEVTPGEAVDGGTVLEFTANVSLASVYSESDYSSIWSLGDRVANGLIHTGHHFASTVDIFADQSQNFDNNYGEVTGSGLNFSDGGSNIPAGDGWWMNFGPWSIDMRAFKLIGGDETGGTSDSWVLRGGLGVGQVMQTCYAQEFDAFTPAQPSDTTDTKTGLHFSEYATTPRAAVPWPHYEFQWAATGRRVTDNSRWCNEILLKVAHSVLDGGDRRLTNSRPEKRVTFSLHPSLSFRDDAGSGFFNPQDALFDGDDWFNASGHTYRCSQILESSAELTTPGVYLQFVFPRKVTIHHILFQMTNAEEDLDSGGDPTLFGTWHWEISKNGGTSWLSVGSAWHFCEGAKYMVAPSTGSNDTQSGFGLRSDANVADGQTHWRMVLDAGPAFGGQTINQIMFNLDDPGNTGVPLRADFSDNDSDTLSGSVTVVAGDPTKIAFSDGDSDALSGTLTAIPNPVLTATFSDGDSDVLFGVGSFSKSTIPQVVVITTGRRT